MYDVGQCILSFVMILTAMWIAYKYLNLFGVKKKINVLGICSWLLYGLYQLVVEYYRSTASIWKLVFGILLVYLVAIFNYYWKKKNVLLVVLQFYVIWAIIEMIVFWVLQSIANEKEDVIGVVISKIIMIISIYIISKNRKMHDEEIIPFKYYISLLFVPLGSIYIAHIIFTEIKVNSFPSMVSVAILLMLNVIIFELYDKLEKVFILEKEKIVYEQQFEIMSRSSAEQKKIREEFHEERHNWNNKLIVLKRSIEKCDKKTVLEVIDNIINVNTDNKYVFTSGNEIVDAIINVKYIVAKEFGILFSCKIFVPEILPIKQCDVGIMLGNAIDNAIDAVKQCRDSERIIEISMGIKKESLVIIVKNPYEHTLAKTKDGYFLSTKSAKEQHGYGLKSIYKVAEQYGGEVITSDEDNYFTIMIFINLP